MRDEEWGYFSFELLASVARNRRVRLRRGVPVGQAALDELAGCAYGFRGHEGEWRDDRYWCAMNVPVFGKLSRAACVAMLLALGGCYGYFGPESDAGPSVTQPVVPLGQASYNVFPTDSYVLRPNDVISLVVFQEPDLSLNQVPVSAGGDISVPLLGPMQVSGMTAAQLETQLERMLNERYLRFAEVTINVVQYGSHLVTVEGSVGAPGLYNFVPGTRLSGAIALANGPTRVADFKDVAVFRQTPEGIAIAKFDYLAMQSGTMMDPVLEPGDRIVVGLSTLSQFWQDALNLIPTFGLFRRF